MFVKSDSIFEDMKEKSGTFGVVAKNPRDPQLKKKKLLKMAQNELGVNGVPKDRISKCFLAKKIIDYRIAE